MARVMIVDDAAFMRAVLARLLEDEGHDVVAQCDSGERAVALYSHFKPDVVTMDVVMPGKSGMDAAREILAADPAARVVMVTSIGEAGVVEEARALGARGYVVKPFAAEQVRAAIVDALAGLRAPGGDAAGAGAGGEDGLRAERVRHAVRFASEKMARAVATLIGTEAAVSGVEVRQEPLRDVMLSAEVTDRPCLGIHFSVGSPEVGAVMVLMEWAQCCLVVDLLGRRQAGTTRALDEYSTSVVREVANILAGAYLSALRQHTRVSLTHSVPALTLDRWRTIVDAQLGAALGPDTRVVVARTEVVAGAPMRWFVLMALDEAIF